MERIRRFVASSNYQAAADFDSIRRGACRFHRGVEFRRHRPDSRFDQQCQVVAGNLADFEAASDHCHPSHNPSKRKRPSRLSVCLKSITRPAIRRRDVTARCEDHRHHQICRALRRQRLAHNAQTAREFPCAKLQPQRYPAENIRNRGRVPVAVRRFGLRADGYAPIAQFAESAARAGCDGQVVSIIATRPTSRPAATN